MDELFLFEDLRSEVKIGGVWFFCNKHNKHTKLPVGGFLHEVILF